MVSNVRAWILAAGLLFHSPQTAKSKQPLDAAFFQYYYPEFRDTLTPGLFGDSFYATGEARRITREYLSIDIGNHPSFNSLEDSIFRLRPNVVGHAIKLHTTGNFRVIHAAVKFACYSIRKNRPGTEWELDDWAGLPRPVASVTQAINGSVAFRTWRSPAEERGQGPPGIHWCIDSVDPNLEEELGISRERFIRSSEVDPEGHFADDLKHVRAAALSDPHGTVGQMKRIYSSALSRSWESKTVDIFIQYNVRNTALTSTDKGFVTDTETSRGYEGPHEPAKVLQETIQAGEDATMIRTSFTPFEIRTWPRQPQFPSDTEITLAIATAVSGTIIEDVLLLHILEGRVNPTTPDVKCAGIQISRPLKFAGLMLLALLDMLPIIFLLASDESFKGRGGAMFALQRHATGIVENGTRRHPLAHPLFLTIETWCVDASGSSRRTSLIVALSFGTIFHALILGHRTAGRIAQRCFRRHRRSE